MSKIEEKQRIEQCLCEQRIATLDKAIKGKSQQLIDHINRDRGGV